MYRQQFSLVVLLGLTTSLTSFAVEAFGQDGWHRPASAAGSVSTLTGNLSHNSADQDGLAPYVLLDHFGVVRGYVASAPGVELEPYVGHQVSLQGAMKTLPGGTMPCMTAEKVMSGEKSARPTVARDFDTQNRRRTAVRPVSYQEPVPTPAPQQLGAGAAQGKSSHVPSAGGMKAGDVPMPYPESGPGAPEVVPGYEAAGGCAGDDCGACGVECETSCENYCGPVRPLFCIGPTGIWLKADYLAWNMRGMHVPALVTSSNNPNLLATDANGFAGVNGVGRLGADHPDTVVLFGDENINDQTRSGGRIQAGVWLDGCKTFGIEGEYLGLENATTSYFRWSDGNPVVSRPFLDTSTVPPIQNVEYVALPRTTTAGVPILNSLDGSIAIDASTRFEAAGGRLVFALYRNEGTWNDPECCGRVLHDSFHSNLLVGYRFVGLDDHLGITENLTTSSGIVPTVTGGTAQGTSAFAIHDQFDTKNRFSGVDLGLQFELQRNRWSLDLMPRIAIGTNHETAIINGTTIFTDRTGAQFGSPGNGGLLAQPVRAGANNPGNIGTYDKNVFAVVPEMDVNFGFQVTPRAKVVVGYTFMYFSNVARAGDQIDTAVNPRLLPAPVSPPFVGNLDHPQFSFQQTSFWAQGVNAGLDIQW